MYDVFHFIRQHLDDYEYDYSDLTVKPEQPTSPFPSSSDLVDLWGVDKHNSTKPTTEPSTTTNVTSSELISAVDVNVTSPTETTYSASEVSLKLTTPQLPLNSHNMQIPVVVVTDASRKEYISSSLIRDKQPNVEALPKRECMNGFFLDEKNRCKKQRLRERKPLPHGLHYAQRPIKSSS